MTIETITPDQCWRCSPKKNPIIPGKVLRICAKHSEPLHNEEWEKAFNNLWASLPMDNRSYRSLVDKKEFEDFKEFIRSLLQSQKDRMREKILKIKPFYYVMAPKIGGEIETIAKDDLLELLK